MNLLVTAAGLSMLTVALAGPFSAGLASAHWVSRAPRAAVMLWQALGVSAAVAAIGAGLCVAVVRFHDGFVTGLADLLRGVVDGHPLRGLGLPDALGLTLAADLGAVLVFLMLSVIVQTVTTRARHRRLLNLLARDASAPPGTVMLEHPGVVAYCLPGLRPRIVVSRGTVRMLGQEELAAVIDHERGHAQEHHGLVLLPMTGLRELFRWIPYARLAPQSVGDLLEMAADDHAARRHPPAVLASALVQMATMSVPPCTFGANTRSVPVRVNRLLSSERSSRLTAAMTGLGAALLVAVPLVALVLS